MKNRNRPVVYKSLGGEVEVNDRVVSGYLASFGTKDSDSDIILKGAFTKSLNERGVGSTTARKIAYLYQHAETDAMDLICSVAAQYGNVPIARVHDAVFFKSRLGPDLKQELEFKLQDATCNKYWHLTSKKLNRYVPISMDAAQDEILHKQSIADEETRALDYFYTCVY